MRRFLLAAALLSSPLFAATAARAQDMLSGSLIEALQAIEKPELGGVFTYIGTQNAPRAFADLVARDKKAMKQVGEAYVPYMEAKLDYWEKQSMKLFGREVPQTMLIHANFINSDYFDDLARMMKKRGYKFVDLETALEDEAYRLPDKFVGAAGISWLHRWALDKGRENILPNEPKVPEFVLKLSGFESE